MMAHNLTTYISETVKIYVIYKYLTYGLNTVKCFIQIIK